MISALLNYDAALDARIHIVAITPFPYHWYTRNYLFEIDYFILLNVQAGSFQATMYSDFLSVLRIALTTSLVYESFRTNYRNRIMNDFFILMKILLNNFEYLPIINETYARCFIKCTFPSGWLLHKQVQAQHIVHLFILFNCLARSYESAARNIVRYRQYFSKWNELTSLTL